MSNLPSLPPPPIEAISHPVVKSASIITAAKLGLFKVIGNKSLSAADLAATLNINELGITCLADVLVSANFLKRSEGLYSNSPISLAWLSNSAYSDFTPAILWMAEVWHLLQDLPDIVRRGGPVVSTWEKMSPESGKIFSQYMLALATLFSEPLVKAVPIKDSYRSLLDLGGSHGLYSIAFCRQHAQLSATIFDLPSALSNTPEMISRKKMTERIRIEEGNYLQDEIPTSIDIVFCSALIHNHSPSENISLFNKIHKSLSLDGVLIIQEFLRTEPPDEFNAVFSLLMLLHSGTRTYTFSEISEWLKEAGFSKIILKPSTATNPQSVICAYKN